MTSHAKSNLRLKRFLRVFVPLVAGAALLLPFALTAQQEKPWEKIPVPKLHDFTPQQPRRIELKNGIVLFLQEDHE